MIKDKIMTKKVLKNIPVPEKGSFEVGMYFVPCDPMEVCYPDEEEEF